MPAMHILIAGRVQGVGFRWFARVAARRLELSGWVRNRQDGTVEVAAAGRQDKLDQFRRQIAGERLGTGEHRGRTALDVTLERAVRAASARVKDRDQVATPTRSCRAACS